MTMRTVLSSLAAGAIVLALFGSPHSASAHQKQKAAPKAPESDLHILPVQGNIYMLVGAGSNITISTGRDGVFLVDAGTSAMPDKAHATVLQLATALTA